MNWKTIILDLEKRGWSLTALGRAIELSPQALSDIKQGRTASPRGMAAVRLNELHRSGIGPPTKAA